jgi:osmotically inducible protein OsmC
MAYTAHATATGGRNGHTATSDGLVSADLSIPKELGGPGKAGASNPEQFFAAGYAACFGSAIEHVARTTHVHVGTVTVDADVTIDMNDGGFFLAVALKAKIEGVDHATADKLVREAHQVCPYSKATRNNIAVDVSAV